MTDSSLTSAIETVNLSMTYRSGKVEVAALNNINLTVNHGEFIAVLGPSGCGKSTLLHLLGGLMQPTSGKVLTDGIDISKLIDAKQTAVRRKKIGYVFQRFNLLHTLSAKGNIDLAKKIHGNGHLGSNGVSGIFSAVGYLRKAEGHMNQASTESNVIFAFPSAKAPEVTAVATSFRYPLFVSLEEIRPTKIEITFDDDEPPDGGETARISYDCEDVNAVSQRDQDLDLDYDHVLDAAAFNEHYRVTCLTDSDMVIAALQPLILSVGTDDVWVSTNPNGPSPAGTTALRQVFHRLDQANFYLLAALRRAARRFKCGSPVYCTLIAGVEMFRKLLDEGMAGDNVGLPLRGTDKKEVERGQVIAAHRSITPHTHFKAQAYVLTKEEGGRHTPFFNGYRPQFYFRTTDVTGVAELPEGTEMVMSGDNVNLTIKLITPIAMEKGLRFAIREGGRTVGAGTISEILE